MRAYLADRTGWTLAYVDTLSLQDVTVMLAYWDGKARAKVE